VENATCSFSAGVYAPCLLLHLVENARIAHFPPHFPPHFPQHFPFHQSPTKKEKKTAVI
jgi:hypothetical protein